ncbi:GerAB/ArcD/ProY family transporter [Brevibacillus migulae]|uniref:GerAB/ArcD/ProY family transporter n=1 Tax=Brevibacillus migulae TaxID=1644114 RepID=UPI00106EAAFF|nr:GerAB/ArcD/ProY family transporter [Brevibacillus migulae]
MKGFERPIEISPTQLVLLVFGTIVGVGFITLPRGVVEKAREDAWITIILAGFVSLVSLWLILRTARIFPKDTLVEYNVKIFGRFCGFLFNLLFAEYFLLFTVTGIRTMAEVVRAEMLPFTPLEAIIIAMLITIFYAAWDGLMPIVRINESGQPITFLLIILFFMIAYLEADWYEIRAPFAEGFLRVVQPIPDTTYSYLGFEILLLYYPFVLKKEKCFWNASTGIALSGAFYSFIVLGALLTLGPDVTMTQTYPVVTMAKMIEIVRQFVERAELLLIILWLPLAYTTHLVVFFSSAFTMNRMFPRISQRWWMGLSIPVIYVLTLIPDNLMEMERWTNYVGVIGMFILFVYPLLLLAGVFVRRKLGLLPASGIQEGEES